MNRLAPQREIDDPYAQARRQAFAGFVSAAKTGIDNMLRTPADHYERGARTNTMTEVQGLFLPRVVNGRLTMTNEQRSGNGTAVVPLAPNEQLECGPEFLDLMPGTINDLAQKFGGQYALNVAEAVGHGLGTTDGQLEPVALTASQGMLTLCNRARILRNGLPVSMPRRRIIAFRQEDARQKPAPVLASDAVHELHHAGRQKHDVIQGERPMGGMLIELASSEFYSYHLGWMALRADDRVRYANHPTVRSTRIVEEYRQANTQPHDPYHANQAVALGMQQRGFIHLHTAHPW